MQGKTAERLRMDLNNHSDQCHLAHSGFWQAPWHTSYEAKQELCTRDTNLIWVWFLVQGSMCSYPSLLLGKATILFQTRS